MKRPTLLLFVSLGLLLAAGGLLAAGRTDVASEVAAQPLALAAPEGVAPEEAATPVIVELFTSEGCSSCPPADRLLAELVQEQPVPGAQIIALSEHVDYWNDLGWRDPYSLESLTQRQRAYARAFESGRVYTPQMIVDGHTEFVGSKSGRAREAIAAAAKGPKADVQLVVEEAAGAHRLRLQVDVQGVPTERIPEGADVLVAVTEDALSQSVTRGENRGRQLTHQAVVRSLSMVGRLEPGDAAFSATPEVALDAAWESEALQAVVFVQARESRQVLGAAAFSVEGVTP